MAPAPVKKLQRSFKYGMPIYGAAWPDGNIFFVCGGGGSTSSGIRNRVVYAESVSGHLTDQLGEFLLGLDCPMRMVIAPNQKSMVLAMGQGGIKRIDLDLRGKIPKMTEVSGDLATRIREEITGEVKCLSFNSSGDQLGLGWVDGSLLVLEWPSLRPRLDLRAIGSRMPDGVRDVSMSFNPRSHLLAAVVDNGTCQIWNWEKSTHVCTAGLARGEYRSDLVVVVDGPEATHTQVLPRGMQGATFARLRFDPSSSSTIPSLPQPASSNTALTARGSAATPGGRGVGMDSSNKSQGEGQLLYALMNNRQGCWVAAWKLRVPGDGMMELKRWKRIGEAPGAALDVSGDGSLLAISTSEGAAMVLSASDFSLIRSEPKAHMVFSTGIYFSADGSHALSTSADASATALPTVRTAVKPLGVTGIRRIVMLIIIFTALFLACFLQALRVLKMQGRMDLVIRVRMMFGYKPTPAEELIVLRGGAPDPVEGQCMAYGGGQCS